MSHQSVLASASVHKYTYTHTHTRQRLPLTWESLMTEAEEPKERPPRVVPPSLSLSPPPLDRTPRHRCSIWRSPDGLSNPISVWHAINKTSRRCGVRINKCNLAQGPDRNQQGRTCTRRAHPRDENHYGPLEYTFNPASCAPDGCLPSTETD